MRVLVIKTSSLGDVVHTLPALTDAAKAYPELRCDWVVEEAFAEIPGWHPVVDRVIPVAIRRWRKAPWKAWRSGEWKYFYQALRSQRYDYIIDAQGLLKSALITALARGRKIGLDRRSAREPLACIAYQRAVTVDRGLHAISRVRRLFAAALGYSVAETEPVYGLALDRLKYLRSGSPYVVFLHGTTWLSKQYPQSHWRELVRLVVAAGYRVIVPWGNDAEYAQAQLLTSNVERAEVLDKTDLDGLAGLLAGASCVVGVDTGLAHLSSALQVPGVFLYGPTNVHLTGVLGKGQQILQQTFDCVPCLQRSCSLETARDGQPVCMLELNPQKVFAAVEHVLDLR